MTDVRPTSDSLRERVERHSPSRGERQEQGQGRASPDVWGVYDPPSGSVQYVVADPATRRAAVIDPVWGFDMRACRTDRAAADQLVALVEREGLQVEWVVDTHPHADHFSAAALLADHWGARTATGERVQDVAAIWRDLYHLPAAALDVEAAWDRLLADGERIELGGITLETMLAPGHTLASVALVAGDAAFVHDTLMAPDAGTARCDFPGGSAAELWNTIERILALPTDTRLFVGHDYGVNGRDAPRWEASVAEQREGNVHVREGTARADWIALREARDATLPLPERMLAALQVNLAGGRLPAPESDGHSYLKLPVNRF